MNAASSPGASALPARTGFARQAGYEVRFDWGLSGVHHVAIPAGGPCVVVDVLSFSTCVDITCTDGRRVWPYRFKDVAAADEAFQPVHSSPGTPQTLTPKSASKAVD